jgi:hypothetical protein
MTSTPHETSDRRPVQTTRFALSVDTLALVLAALMAIAVVAGLLPALPW